MNALISIVDEANNDKQEFLIKDIVDKNNLYFSSEGYCLLVNIFNEGLCMEIKGNQHNSKMTINDRPILEINSPEGNIIFYPKVIANKKNNDIISIVYCIDEIIRKIEIKYIGE